MTDASKRVYDDHDYTSFDAALKEAVISIARFRMPVGVLGHAGGHAQVLTGYVVTGEDPTTSDDFVVNGLYMSDPLRSDAISIATSLRRRSGRGAFDIGSRSIVRSTARSTTRTPRAIARARSPGGTPSGGAATS